MCEGRSDIASMDSCVSLDDAPLRIYNCPSSGSLATARADLPCWKLRILKDAIAQLAKGLVPDRSGSHKTFGIACTCTRFVGDSRRLPVSEVHCYAKTLPKGCSL